jgi:hypothetical protein
LFVSVEGLNLLFFKGFVELAGREVGGEAFPVIEMDLI